MAADNMATSIGATSVGSVRRVFLAGIKLEKMGTAREQLATILLPNCRILNGTWKADAVRASEKC
jgi:hypothetical protein